MTVQVSRSQLRAAIAAVLDCGDTMDAQGEALQTSLPALTLPAALRVRVMERVADLRETSGRATFAMSMLQAEIAAGEAGSDPATVVQGLSQVEAAMMGSVVATVDVVEELERAAETDQADCERAFALVMEAIATVMQRLKAARAATQAFRDAAVPRASGPRSIQPPPVQVAANGSVVILQAGAEGGDVTLIGRSTETGTWTFARVTDDQTEALFGESGDGVVQGPSFENLEWVDTWDDALRLMDRYRWARLHPLVVHPEFVEHVRVAVEVRLAQEDQDRWTEHARGKWERLFGRSKAR